MSCDILLRLSSDVTLKVFAPFLHFLNMSIYLYFNGSSDLDLECWLEPVHN